MHRFWKSANRTLAHGSTPVSREHTYIFPSTNIQQLSNTFAIPLINLKVYLQVTSHVAAREWRENGCVTFCLRTYSASPNTFATLLKKFEACSRCWRNAWSPSNHSCAGIVNLLVGTAPLLRPQPHAVLLTSFMAFVSTLHLYKDTGAFYKKLLCMTSQAAALLLGMHCTFTHNSFSLPSYRLAIAVC